MSYQWLSSSQQSFDFVEVMKAGTYDAKVNKKYQIDVNGIPGVVDAEIVKVADVETDVSDKTDKSSKTKK